MNGLKEQFISIFESNIRREGADKLLTWLNESDFFVAPASTKYHGAHEGGLLEHSINVYHYLKRSVEEHGLGEYYSDETVAIVALLHDLCKVNLYARGFRNVKEDGQWVQKEIYEHKEQFPCGHGEKSVIIAQNFMHLTGDEIHAIRAHMGGWDTSVKAGDYFISRIFESCKFAVLVHLADMEATYLFEGRG